MRKITNGIVLMLRVVVFEIWLAGLLPAADCNTFLLGLGNGNWVMPATTLASLRATAALFR